MTRRAPVPTSRAARTGLAVAGMAAAALAAVGLALGACAPTASTGDAAPEAAAAADSLLGTVAVVGAEPLTRVVLETDAGDVDLQGDSVGLLHRANGLTVRVHGRAGPGGFRVDRFGVVRAAGLPAVDGTLELDGQAAVLITATGETIRFPTAPADLRARVGQWVWIAGEPGSEPVAWGSLSG